jgi:hypothetical protein
MVTNEIRQDSDWKNGDYATQLRAALRNRGRFSNHRGKRAVSDAKKPAHAR